MPFRRIGLTHLHADHITVPPDLLGSGHTRARTSVATPAGRRAHPRRVFPLIDGDPGQAGAGRRRAGAPGSDDELLLDWVADERPLNRYAREEQTTDNRRRWIRPSTRTTT